jgi:hypothetical protein
MDKSNDFIKVPLTKFHWNIANNFELVNLAENDLSKNNYR